MLPSKKYPITLGANGTQRLLVSGNYFKILAATGAVDVRSDFGRMDSLIFGQGLEKTPFSYLEFRDASGAANNLTIFIGDENFIDGQTGNFAVTATVPVRSASFVNANPTVTTASAQLIAANVNRAYLLIQNKDASGQIYINFGFAATVANGVQISPGGAYELSGNVSTQQIFAIGSIASNANVVTVEG